MPRIMAQEQSSGVRRRSLESAMKEPQARTKVVLRHLPPSISQAVLLEHIDSKYAGSYTWFSFHPGKSSHKRQVPSQAYINFKKPEDVYDFYEDFEGRIFVNERGMQSKASVEYAPYQRIPKPRSKKDIREGTITKDPDYIEFLEILGKPAEFLPSAEVQLERREAEKAAVLAAGGAKEGVVVTPLMEFVRQRRAAKATPQRSLSSKLASRSGGVAIATLNIASHKRGLERSRSGPLMYVADNSMSMSLLTSKDSKEIPAQILGSRRDDQQRKEREPANERKKKEGADGKEKKTVRDSLSPSITLAKGNSATPRMDTSKDRHNIAASSKDSVDLLMDSDVTGNEGPSLEVDPPGSHGIVTGKAAISMTSLNDGISGEGTKDMNRRELLRRKQQLLPTKDKLHKDEAGPGSPGLSSSGGGSSYNQRHRPPVSPRVTSPSTASQGAASFYGASSGEGTAPTGLSKSSHRREVTGRNASRGGLSPREHQSGVQQSGSSPLTVMVDSQPQTQQGNTQSDRGGKRPPRPQSARGTGKDHLSPMTFQTESDVGSFAAEEKGSNTSTKDSFSPSSSLDRQDSRRVRNKDRPDRPVWTPRRRSDTVQSSEPSASLDASTSELPAAQETMVSGSSQIGVESNSKLEKGDRGSHRQGGKGSAMTDLSSGESKATSPHLGSGQVLEGGRSQSGYGTPATFNSASGKVRYVETISTRASRGGRLSAGNVLSIQERPASTQGEQKADTASTVGDPKSYQNASYNERENGENHQPSAVDKERRKQDGSLGWSELTGGGHRLGGRRERGLQQTSKEADGGMAGAELSKPVKRSGSLALGGNEKQVWVAVQKSGSGT